MHGTQSVLNYCFKLLIFSHCIPLENSLLYKQLRELLLFLTVLKVAIFSWGYYDIDSAFFFLSKVVFETYPGALQCHQLAQELLRCDISWRRCHMVQVVPLL